MMMMMMMDVVSYSAFTSLSMPKNLVACLQFTLHRHVQATLEKHKANFLNTGQTYFKDFDTLKSC
jgi:hypothetical protein